MATPRRGVPLRLEDRFGRVGGPMPFVWEAPESVDPTATVTLRVHYGDGDVEVNLTALINSTVAINAAEGVRLTPAEVGDLAALREAAGRFGGGYLDTAEHGTFPVHVVRVGSADIEIGDFTSRSIDGSIDATLTMAIWHGSIPDRDQVDEDVRWSVTYPVDGTDFVEEGILSWVRQPFSTGLTPSALLRAAPPRVLAKAADREQDHWSAIMEGFEELVADMRRRLVASGLREYDLVGCPPGLRQAHINLTIANLVRSSPDLAEAHRARALGVFNDRSERIGGQIETALRSVITADDSGELAGRRPVQGPRTGRPSLGNFKRLATTRTRKIH